MRALRLQALPRPLVLVARFAMGGRRQEFTLGTLGVEPLLDIRMIDSKTLDRSDGYGHSGLGLSGVGDGMANDSQDTSPARESPTPTWSLLLTIVMIVISGFGAYHAKLAADLDLEVTKGAVRSDRLASVGNQLGHAEPMVRIAGIYNLRRLVDDYDDLAGPAAQMLAAFVALNTSESGYGTNGVQTKELHIAYGHLRQISGVDDVRVDLAGVHVNGAQLRDFGAKNSYFVGTTFSTVTLDESVWSCVDASNAVFRSGTNMADATFTLVNLSGADFGDLQDEDSPTFEEPYWDSDDPPRFPGSWEVPENTFASKEEYMARCNS